MNNEELINALTIIHNECDANLRCQNCPFGDKNGVCKITDSAPSNWLVNKDEDIWRALK